MNVHLHDDLDNSEDVHLGSETGKESSNSAQVSEDLDKLSRFMMEWKQSLKSSQLSTSGRSSGIKRKGGGTSADQSVEVVTGVRGWVNNHHLGITDRPSKRIQVEVCKRMEIFAVGVKVHTLCV